MGVARDQIANAAMAEVTGSGNVGSATITWTSNPVAGAKVFVAISVWQGGGSAVPSTVQDNGTSVTTLTQRKTVNIGTNVKMYWYDGDNISLPSSGSYKVTVTLSASTANSIDAGGITYTGVLAGGPSSSSTNTGSGTTETITGIGGAGDALLFGFVANTTGTNSAPTFSAPFTGRTTSNNGSSAVVSGVGDDIGIGPQNLSATTGSGSWGAIGVSYQAAPPTQGAQSVPQLFAPGVTPGGLGQFLQAPFGFSNVVPSKTTQDAKTRFVVNPAITVAQGFLPGRYFAPPFNGPIPERFTPPQYSYGNPPTTSYVDAKTRLVVNALNLGGNHIPIANTSQNHNDFMGGAAQRHVVQLYDGSILVTVFDGNSSKWVMYQVANPYTNPTTTTVSGFQNSSLTLTADLPDMYAVNHGDGTSDIWIADGATNFAVQHAKYQNGSFTWDTRTNIPSGASSVNTWYVQIIWTGTYLIAAWSDTQGGASAALYVAWTTDITGQTGWTTTANQLSSTTTTTTLRAASALTHDSISGNTVVAYITGSANPRNIYSQTLPDTSTPSPANWSGEHQINSVSATIDTASNAQWDDFVAIRLLAYNGHAHFLYADATNSSGHPNLAYVSGTVGTGVTWGSTITIDPPAANDTMPALTLDQSGRVYAFWGYEPGPVSGDIKYVTIDPPYTAVSAQTNLTNNINSNAQAVHAPEQVPLPYGYVPLVYATGAANPWTIYLDTSIPTVVDAPRNPGQAPTKSPLSLYKFPSPLLELGYIQINRQFVDIGTRFVVSVRGTQIISPLLFPPQSPSPLGRFLQAQFGITSPVSQFSDIRTRFIVTQSFQQEGFYEQPFMPPTFILGRFHQNTFSQVAPQTQYSDLKTRFLVQSNSFVDVGTRFVISIAQTGYVEYVFNPPFGPSILGMFYQSPRAQDAPVVQYSDLKSRFKIKATTYQDLLTRFVVGAPKQGFSIYPFFPPNSPSFLAKFQSPRANAPFSIVYGDVKSRFLVIPHVGALSSYLFTGLMGRQESQLGHIQLGINRTFYIGAAEQQTSSMSNTQLTNANLITTQRRSFSVSVQARPFTLTLQPRSFTIVLQHTSQGVKA